MSSAYFDGEAPETDDEEERAIPEISKTVEKKPVSEKNVDKTLKKRWNTVATGAIGISQKRLEKQEKTMEIVTESAANCFTSMQNVASKLNVIHANVARLEDSVADLLDAARLFPSKLPKFDLKIPEFN